MSFDWSRGRAVVFGGIANEGVRRFADTWEWDGSTWTQSTPATLPRTRSWPAMAYDAGRSRTVMFGGWDAAISKFYADTWEWNGIDWSLRTTTGTPPEAGSGAIAYDLGRAHIVMARLDALWRYGDGTVSSAATVPIGSPCVGTNGPPVLTSVLPLLGSGGFAIDLIAARAASPCAFGLSTSTLNLAVGGGCSLYLGNPLVTFATSSGAAGFATLGLAIPNMPALRGGVFYAQGFVVDPQGGFAGLAVTRGLKLVLGN